MSEHYRVTIVSHTHWDRAWYITFQEFRARLVRLVDRLLKLLEEQPGYRIYTLDGQMAVLEDYLEVRPQRKARLQELCLEGRLKVGPWYVLADEFLVSPEALIRNMQLGHRIGQEYGGVSKLGYVPDGFGHIAQMPQILNGFGIDNAFFWRGLGEEGDKLGTEFTWEAPDGSSVTTIWMPWGYHNISNLGFPIHWGDTSQMVFDPDLALKQIRQAVDHLTPLSNTLACLLMNGIDHEEAEPRIPEIVDMANQAMPDCQFQHGSLQEHLNTVREEIARDGITLPVFCGEFRWGKYSEILQGVYATRIHLKQINHRIENLYEKYTEPLDALAWLSGADIPEGTQDLLWTGWRWLLKNHPHDDIYGSGIDQVHHEMLHRFDQAEQIGLLLIRDSLRQLCREVDFSEQNGVPLIVYNPLAWERREIVCGDVDFDYDDPLANDFCIMDRAGLLVPFQILADREEFWMETLKANRKRRLKIAFPAIVPSCGYTIYYVAPSEQASPEVGFTDDWRWGDTGAENRFLSFTIASDGGLDVLDKSNGQLYKGLGHIEDVEDAGDEYSYCPCGHSETITTKDRPAQFHLVASGSNLVTYEIIRYLPIPQGLTEDRQRRSEERIDHPVISRVTIYRNQPGIFIETEIDNRAKDHKLSVSFPIPFSANTANVDESFAVLPRSLDLPDSTGWVEDPNPLMHQRSFTDVSVTGRGLAIMNRGLPAVEVTHTEESTQISLTLLRSVGWLSRDDLFTRRVAAGPLVPTPGAQCLGKYSFEYALLPHEGHWQAVYPVAYRYVSPLLLTRADTHEGLDLHDMNITRDDPSQIKPIPFPRSGSTPGQVSFLSVDVPELVLSALYRARNQPDGVPGKTFYVRFYNPIDRSIDACFTSYRELDMVWETNLNEERIQKLVLNDNHSFRLTIGKHKIITFEIEPKFL
jgi:mannosylglycerate hydrolase